VRWDAVVVGSGIGGLACAGVLAAAGRSVVVLEQAKGPGGYLASFERRGFTFDAAVDCVAGFDPDGLLTWILQALGVEDAVRPIRLDPIRMSRFPGLTVSVDAELPAYVDRLCQIFPDERHGIAAFFRRADEIYADAMTMVEAVKHRTPPAGALNGAWMRYGNLTYMDLLDLDIRDRRLVAVLSDRCPFLGLSPRHASATRLVTLVMSYFRSGAYRPRGGHQQLADALVQGIRRKGGIVYCGRSVHAIEVEGNRCTRVLTDDGGEFVASRVVSSADFLETFGRLIGGNIGTGVLASHSDRPISPSFFIGYLGVRRERSLAASSIGSFPTFDLDSFLGRYTPFSHPDPLGVTIPTVEDPTLAPAGHDVLIVHELIPATWACDWCRDKDALLDKALSMAEHLFPGLRDRVVHCEAATPSTLERYTRNQGGAAYGWDQGPFRMRVRHGMSNLFLGGHWNESGGVLAAAYSGARAARQILNGAE
jgi:phytoene dehydrogenase-like protein